MTLEEIFGPEFAPLIAERNKRWAEFDAQHTVADVPELLAVWADDADPATVQLNADGEFLMRCINGHAISYKVANWRAWMGRAKDVREQSHSVVSKKWVPCCNQHGAEFQAADRAEQLPAGTSRVELLHHAAAERIFGSAESGAKLALSRVWSVDILVGTTVIEYDGRRWHGGSRSEVDARKTMDLLAAGYRVVRLRESGLESLGILHPNYREISVSPSDPQPTEVINAVKLWVDAA